MNKDKEWFIKELLGHEIGDYGNYYNSGYEDGLAYALKLAHQLNEPEKVVIPQFVADWISRTKKWGYSISDSMGHVGSYFDTTQYDKAMRWAKKNQDVFARAWLDGYEVEKEKLYYTVDEKGKTLLYKSQARGVIRSNGAVLETVLMVYEHKSSNMYQLTEKEIKDYDERFWSFAQPVEETL